MMQNVISIQDYNYLILCVLKEKKMKEGGGKNNMIRMSSVLIGVQVRQLQLSITNFCVNIAFSNYTVLTPSETHLPTWCSFSSIMFSRLCFN